jgi:hypothetical protein
MEITQLNKNEIFVIAGGAPKDNDEYTVHSFGAHLGQFVGACAAGVGLTFLTELYSLPNKGNPIVIRRAVKNTLSSPTLHIECLAIWGIAVTSNVAWSMLGGIISYFRGNHKSTNTANSGDELLWI